MESHTTDYPVLPGNKALELLQELHHWGNTTTIILHGGSVFEFKGIFPLGFEAEGFYNLKGESGFEGHLNLGKVDRIQLVSRQHRGRDSHSFTFLDKSGENIFKIFLGREQDGELIQSQLEKFEALKASV